MESVLNLESVSVFLVSQVQTVVFEDVLPTPPLKSVQVTEFARTSSDASVKRLGQVSIVPVRNVSMNVFTVPASRLESALVSLDFSENHANSRVVLKDVVKTEFAIRLQEIANVILPTPVLPARLENVRILYATMQENVRSSLHPLLVPCVCVILNILVCPARTRRVARIIIVTFRTVYVQTDFAFAKKVSVVRIVLSPCHVQVTDVRDMENVTSKRFNANVTIPTRETIVPRRRLAPRTSKVKLVPITVLATRKHYNVSAIHLTSPIIVK